MGINSTSEAVKSPETIQVHLTKLIEKAHGKDGKGFLSKEHFDKMLTSLNNTVDFLLYKTTSLHAGAKTNPRFQTSFKNIIASTKKELAVKKREYIKEKGIVTNTYAQT